MSSKTLEDEKPPGEEPQTQDNHSKQEEETVEAEPEVDGKDVQEKNEEDAVDEGDNEDEEEEDEHEDEETKESPKVGLNKSRKGSDPATPASDRPSRERKTVERYTVSSPSKFPRWSSIQTWSIEKDRSEQERTRRRRRRKHDLLLRRRRSEQERMRQRRRELLPLLKLKNLWSGCFDSLS